MTPATFAARTLATAALAGVCFVLGCAPFDAPDAAPFDAGSATAPAGVPDEWPEAPRPACDADTASKQDALDLLSVVRAGDIPGAGAHEMHRLAPEWVGTLETKVQTYQFEPIGADREHIRLTHVWIDRDGHVIAARANDHHEHIQSEAARFSPTLPPIEQFASARSMPELVRALGPDHTGISDGWGCEGGVCTDKGWDSFTLADGGKLRWLSVFAIVVIPFPNGRPDPDNARVDALTVREGLFRVADACSAEERRTYKSGEDLDKEDQARKAQARALLAEPLRSFVAARQNPHDYDLDAYKRAIAAIRKDPRPELFEQIAEHFHEGMVNWPSLEAHVPPERDGLPGIDPWQPAMRRRALEYAVASLPLVKTREGLMQLTIQLLQSLGGGHLILEEPRIDLKVVRDGYSYAAFNVADDRVRDGATRIVAWLRAHYSELKE